MECAMEKEQRCAAQGQMIALMHVGHSWQQAAAMASMKRRNLLNE